MTRAPKIRSCATLGSGANSGTKMTHGRPTLAAAPASDVAALPVEAQATTLARRERARATPTALARSLKEAVGFLPSSLTRRRRTPGPLGEPRRVEDRRPAGLEGGAPGARRAPAAAPRSARRSADATAAPAASACAAPARGRTRSRGRPRARTPGRARRGRARTAARTARRRGRSRSRGSSRAALPDAAVDLVRPLLLGDPPRRVLLGPQLRDGLALLLDPGEVLLVVPAAARLGRALDQPAGAPRAEDLDAAASPSRRPSAPARRRGAAGPTGSGRSRRSPPSRPPAAARGRSGRPPGSRRGRCRRR